MRYAVTLVLVRNVRVEVEASNERDAQEEARYRSRWLKSEGTRSRLKLLTMMEITKLEDAL